MDQKTLSSDARIAQLLDQFAHAGYIGDRKIATALFLAQELTKPLLVEGPPGVGKTELAKAAAELLDLPLVRLQCYEGLDESKALYEWQYGKQLLYTQVLREKLSDVMGDATSLAQSMEKLKGFEDVFFSPQFIHERPLLAALQSDAGCVLLIDEIDKADNEFEAFLLELLSDYQITIPEIGTVSSSIKPIVFLTSNNTRELSDALKRRCLHLYIPFPDPQREATIIASRVPDLDEKLRHHLVQFVASIRELDLKKPPAVSETIDWARTLVLLNISELTPEFVSQTLNVLLKFQSDIEIVDPQTTALLRHSSESLSQTRH